VRIKHLDGNWWYTFKMKAFNDFSAAIIPEMTVQLAGVDDVATVTTVWTQHRAGWHSFNF
jgi:hypothetical protein